MAKERELVPDQSTLSTLVSVRCISEGTRRAVVVFRKVNGAHHPKRWEWEAGQLAVGDLNAIASYVHVCVYEGLLWTFGVQEELDLPGL